ncbi:MAG: HutP family protein [Acidaminococcaceae bacterium]
MVNRLAGLLQDSVKTPGVAAMLLALTRTLHDEEVVKAAIIDMGHKFVVTEVGGRTGFEDFQEKVNRAVIGASLNANIIEKIPNEVHAIVHATEEAKRGILINVSSSASLALKIAIVRDEHWIAVAMFGQSALHYMTNHERAGLGIMHI